MVECGMERSTPKNAIVVADSYNSAGYCSEELVI
jgi:hypothetical protein